MFLIIDVLDVFPRHVKGEKLEKTVWCLLNFHSYVKNYVKVGLKEDAPLQ